MRKTQTNSDELCNNYEMTNANNSMRIVKILQFLCSIKNNILKNAMIAQT